MKVFVTGGSGLVGSHTIQALIARGDTVLALSRSTTADAALQALGARTLRGDIGEESALARGVAEAEVTVHAAAVVLARADWARFHATNVAPTETVARACARARQRLVHISSVAVYGRRTTYDGGARSVTEEFGLDRPIFPGDHYARSKREAEKSLWRIAGETGLSAVALRPCVIYGEGDRAFAIRVARTLRRGFAPLIGGGHNQLGIVYAGNVAAAVLGAIDHPGVTGPFNVCNDGPLTEREFLERFAQGLGVRLRTVNVPRGLAWNAARIIDALTRVVRPRAPLTTLKTAVQFLANDNPYVSEKAAKQLGWTPVLAPPEAVERTARWFRDRS